jgi:tetratricopeptide repeat protein 21B
MTPLIGMIYCRVRQDQLDDAEQQLEFINEINEANNSGSSSKNADLVYLEALIEWRKRGNADSAIKLLDQALNLHIAATK